MFNISKIKITYQRDIEHCSVTPYAKEVTVAVVRHADNSDALDSISFEETGRFAVVRRDAYKPGDKVFFIPAESILPFELSEALDVTKYTSRGKVKVAKLRGNRSEGLVVDKNIVEPYIPYIMKWEDPPTAHMMGDALSSQNIPLEFEKFYKMPNLLDEPKIFKQGEKLFWSIKIHGTNCRFGYLQNPQTNEYELYVGSHNMVLKESLDNLYWKTIIKMLTHYGVYPNNMDLIKDLVFYGEIYGLGVQKGFHYDEKTPTVKLFSIVHRYKYIDVSTFRKICNELGFPMVEHNKMIFRDIEELKELADNVEGLTKSHTNEGIVVVSAERPDTMAKVISFEYLAKSGRTERH